jgi:type VII secretion system (Wss) protein YukD
MLRLKVMVSEVWLPLLLEVPSDTTVTALKDRVLDEATIGKGNAAEYEVKVGGAQVRDESRTLAEVGVGDGASLIILPRRRRAVR